MSEKEKRIYFLWDFKTTKCSLEINDNINNYKEKIKEKIWYSYVITKENYCQLKLLQKNNKFFEILNQDFIDSTIPNIISFSTNTHLYNKFPINVINFHFSEKSFGGYNEGGGLPIYKGRKLDIYLEKMIFISNLVVRLVEIFNLPTDIIKILYEVLWLK